MVVGNEESKTGKPVEKLAWYAFVGGASRGDFLTKCNSETIAPHLTDGLRETETIAPHIHVLFAIYRSS
jgi:hypothetical protein